MHRMTRALMGFSADAAADAAELAALQAHLSSQGSQDPQPGAAGVLPFFLIVDASESARKVSGFLCASCLLSPGQPMQRPIAAATAVAAPHECSTSITTVVCPIKPAANICKCVHFCLSCLPGRVCQARRAKGCGSQELRRSWALDVIVCQHLSHPQLS